MTTTSFYCWQRSDFHAVRAKDLQRYQEIGLAGPDGLYGIICIEAMVYDEDHSVAVLFDVPSGAQV